MTPLDTLFQLPFAEAKAIFLREFKAAYVKAALETSRGNKSKAARHAGKDRSGFRRLMREGGAP